MHFKFCSACCIHTHTCLNCVVMLLSCMFQLLFAALARLDVQGNVTFLLFFCESLCKTLNKLLWAVCGVGVGHGAKAPR